MIYVAVGAEGHRAGGGVTLTRVGFMLIAPPFVTAYHAAEVRSQALLTLRHEEDSNSQIRFGQKLSHCAKIHPRTVI